MACCSGIMMLEACRDKASCRTKKISCSRHSGLPQGGQLRTLYYYNGVAARKCQNARPRVGLVYQGLYAWNIGFVGVPMVRCCMRSRHRDNTSGRMFVVEDIGIMDMVFCFQEEINNPQRGLPNKVPRDSGPAGLKLVATH